MFYRKRRHVIVTSLADYDNDDSRVAIENCANGLILEPNTINEMLIEYEKDNQLWIHSPNNQSIDANDKKTWKKYKTIITSKNIEQIKQLPVELRFKFKCPVSLARLQRTQDDFTDFCTICNKHVHVVQSEAELNNYIHSNKCVALVSPNSVSTMRRSGDYIVVGGI